MSNEITSILQTLAPHHKVPGKTQEASQPTVVEKPVAPQGDRVSLSDSAQRLQLAETKPGPNSAPRLDSPAVGMTNARNESNMQSDSKPLPAQENALRPSPALSNMMEAFLTTSDMKGFDVNSDLNADGVINFHDLAALREIEIGTGSTPPETIKDQLHKMAEAFLSSEGSDEFDATSDLNDDGMINFNDLAILRSRIENS